MEQHVLEPAAIAAGLLCAAALGALHQAARAKRAVLWALCALAVGDGAAAAGFAAAGAPREAFTPAASALTYLLLAGALQRSEPLFLDACAGLGLLLLFGGRVADPVLSEAQRHTSILERIAANTARGSAPVPGRGAIVKIKSPSH